MIELAEDELAFSFPEVHPEAKLNIVFQRTLRIPDDGKTYPLPPGLGAFPLKHVDDYANNIPVLWLERGGIMLPMFQAEAMWLCFDPKYDLSRGVEYPFAIKVAAGKINAVTGQSWSNELHRNSQDYLVAPPQPWLDGYCVEAGTIRQFVAMPLGKGYSAEEQITGKAEFGGIQIIVYPMKREVFERRFAVRDADERECVVAFDESEDDFDDDALDDNDDEFVTAFDEPNVPARRSMGLAPGGRMQQEIYLDPHNLDDWDTEHASRCFVHLVNAEVWRAITGMKPPTPAPTAKTYSQYGLPWFDYYAEGTQALHGPDLLARLKSVAELGKEKRETPLPENESCPPTKIVKLQRKRIGNQVRDGDF
jgi:hypothetical protein